MKCIYQFSIFLVLIVTTKIRANPLHFTTENALFYHLTEVNQQWNNQDDLHQLDLTKVINFKNDNQRIQQHLKLVYRVLSNRSTNHLTEKQQANRQRHLTVLKSYYETAVFPTNHYHTKRQPYFVDNYNVHCAVGYLLQQDGQIELVSTIRKNDNYAYVHELTKYSQLEIWAKANGFTVNELAWIQPGYSPTNQFSAVGNGSGVDGEVFCFEKSYDGETLYIGGDFTTINGINSSCVAAFDGTDFTAIGGIFGTVHDMAFYQGKLYVAGEFTLSTGFSPINIAVWDGTSWTALQTGNMFGTVYTMEIFWSRLYIGGNFHKVNNTSMSYLAEYNLATQQWSNDGRININNNWTTIPNGLSVDSTVYDMEIVEGKLLVGGAFTAVAPNVSNPDYNKFTTSHLAYWDYSGQWIQGFNTSNNVVRAMYFYDGRLFTGSQTGMNVNNSFSYLSAGLWTHYSGMNGLNSFDDNQFNHFFSFNGSVYAVGGLNFLPLLGTYGKGIVKVYSENHGLNFEGAGFTSSSVNAAIEFKDKAYFGGGFDTINNQQVNGLAVSELDLATTTESIKKDNDSKVWCVRDYIIIESKNQTPSDFTLFNINGQIVHQSQNIRVNRHEIPVSHLPKGVYFYKIKNGNSKTSGKVAVY